jgi:hypothetical protein
MARLNVIFVSALLREDGLTLPALLENSLSRNRSNSVRSMTLFSAGSLMQVIDGDASETRTELGWIFHNACYRHSIVLNEEEVEGPTLDCTSLGALNLLPATIKRLPAGVSFFSLSENAVAQRVRLGIARNLLRQFAADYS